MKDLHWLPVRLRIIFKVLCLIFKCLQGTAPSYLSDILPETRENRFVRIPRTKSTYGDHAFCRFGPIYWNALPNRLIHCGTINNFKAQLKHYLFSSSHDYFTNLNRYRNWIQHNVKTSQYNSSNLTLPSIVSLDNRYFIHLDQNLNQLREEPFV